eukprot:gnl/Carplike_NY0171/7849_a10865_173.p1 GENE.gnl/Carplike_NY0171/7849_a10865_173~~gnl/Carplike_NY0171/7849_a10865_173.p1  ORF type:complete len:164 (+),score=43.49 gnl/Carplike_NY0171/7849_a10865_173:59-493(+)
MTEHFKLVLMEKAKDIIERIKTKLMNYSEDDEIDRLKKENREKEQQSEASELTPRANSQKNPADLEANGEDIKVKEKPSSPRNGGKQLKKSNYGSSKKSNMSSPRKQHRPSLNLVLPPLIEGLDDVSDSKDATRLPPVLESLNE